MAKEVITGLTGSVAFGSASQWVGSFTISTGAELLDTSHYGGPSFRTRVQGIQDLAGAVAFVTKGDAGSNPFNLANVSGTITITFATGCSISFTGVIGNVQIVGSFEGLNVVTFSWAYDDDEAPTIAWVES